MEHLEGKALIFQYKLFPLRVEKMEQISQGILKYLFHGFVEEKMLSSVPFLVLPLLKPLQQPCAAPSGAVKLHCSLESAT